LQLPISDVVTANGVEGVVVSECFVEMASPNAGGAKENIEVTTMFGKKDFHLETRGAYSCHERLSEVECGKLGRQRTEHGCLMSDETAMMLFLSKDTMIALLQDCEHERTLLSFNMIAVANYNCLAAHLQLRYNG
jgi:hypothetical protein